MSKHDVFNTGDGDESLFEIGWHLGITLPNLDDVDFTQVFEYPKAALEFGISQILSGALSPAPALNRLQGEGIIHLATTILLPDRLV